MLYLGIGIRTYAYYYTTTQPARLLDTLCWIQVTCFVPSVLSGIERDFVQYYELS